VAPARQRQFGYFMAAPQKTESRPPVMTLSLFAVLATAKVAMIAGRDVQFTPLAFADDAVVATAFGIIELLTQRCRWIAVTLYIGLVSYAAINVPLARLTSSPLTVQMFRATGSALSDSIAHHLTATNVAFMALIGFFATALPFAIKRLSPRICVGLFGPILLVVALGFWFPKRPATARNAFTVLGQSAWPRVHARALHDDWRRPITPPSSSVVDLEFLRGTAAGRNIVMISLESAGAQYLKLYGATNDPMPNLTRLAQSSVVFESAYAVYPESIKGLFSVLCSRYSAFDTEAADYARVRTPAIADVARQKGYRTALFHSGRFMYLGMRDIINGRGFEVLEDAGDIGGNHESSFGVDEPATVARILHWVESLKESERFFGTYLPIAGHHPYEVPDDTTIAGATERDRYLNALRYADAALGQLFDGLKHRGAYSNTLFVIYGDHGEAFGQHKANFGHTFFVYEENVRVPLVIAVPGLIHASIRARHLASLIDLAPTIADIAGLATPTEWQGTSLLNTDSRVALFFTDYSLPLVGVRDGPWKAICEIDGRSGQLFHIESDPAEGNDLAAQHSELIAVYRERAHRWAAAQKALLKP
jgi:glucan phosphoethanolaminetransferase (alkaline phosphatase superfamily)